MTNMLLVHILQCQTYLLDILNGYSLIQGTMQLHIISQQSTTQILHYIIDRIIFLKHIYDFNDMRMIHLCKVLCFLNKLLAIQLYQGTTSLGRNGYLPRPFLSFTSVLHKELLDCHWYIDLHITQRT